MSRARSGSRRTAAARPPAAQAPHGLRGSWLANEAVVVLSVPLGSSERPLLAGLTRAERGVIDAVLEGKSGAQIAATRGVKRATVYKQLENAYRKLGVRSRAELSALIWRGSKR